MTSPVVRARGGDGGASAPASGPFHENLHGVRGDGRQGDRCAGVGLQRGVRHPSHMPELVEDHPTGGVNRIGDFAPTRNLFKVVDPGCPGVALPARFDLRTFGHHEPGATALRVVIRHEFVGYVAGLRTARTGQRGRTMRFLTS